MQQRKTSSWQLALKKFNETTDNWVIPKVGTKAYDKVKKIQKKMSKAQTLEPKSVTPVEATPIKEKKVRKKKAKKPEAAAPVEPPPAPAKSLPDISDSSDSDSME